MTEYEDLLGEARRVGVFGAWRAAFIVARASSRTVLLASLAVPAYFLALTASGRQHIHLSSSGQGPAGPRVQLSALAQLPGSSGVVLFEVRAALRRLPKGMVVVAVAGTEDLAKRYESWGFTRGTARRVFLRVH